MKGHHQLKTVSQGIWDALRQRDVEITRESDTKKSLLDECANLVTTEILTRVKDGRIESTKHRIGPLIVRGAYHHAYAKYVTFETFETYPDKIALEAAVKEQVTQAFLPDYEVSHLNIYRSPVPGFENWSDTQQSCAVCCPCIFFPWYWWHRDRLKFYIQFGAKVDM